LHFHEKTTLFTMLLHEKGVNLSCLLHCFCSWVFFYSVLFTERAICWCCWFTIYWVCFLSYPDARWKMAIGSTDPLMLCDTIKELMSYPKCRNVEVINNPARPGSNHREVNYINYK
jgi:hypothetical protein